MRPGRAIVLTATAAMLVAGCGGGDEAAPPVRTTVSPVDPAEVGGPLPQALSLVAAGRIYILRAGQGVRADGRQPRLSCPRPGRPTARCCSPRVRPGRTLAPRPHGRRSRSARSGRRRASTGATWSPDGALDRRAARRTARGVRAGGAERPVGTTAAPGDGPTRRRGRLVSGRHAPGRRPGRARRSPSPTPDGGRGRRRLPVGAGGTPAAPGLVARRDEDRVCGSGGGVQVVAGRRRARRGAWPRRVRARVVARRDADRVRRSAGGRNGVVSPERGGLTLLPGCRCDLPRGRRRAHDRVVVRRRPPGVRQRPRQRAVYGPARRDRRDHRGRRFPALRRAACSGCPARPELQAAGCPPARRTTCAGAPRAGGGAAPPRTTAGPRRRRAVGQPSPQKGLGTGRPCIATKMSSSSRPGAARERKTGSSWPPGVTAAASRPRGAPTSAAPAPFRRGAAARRGSSPATAGAGGRPTRAP